MRAYRPERLNKPSSKKHPAWGVLNDHRNLCGGAVLSIAVMSSIFVNAVWFQAGMHPSPLFSTRTEILVKSLNNNPADVAVLKSAKKNKNAAASPTSKELLREVQTALSVRGYYSGKLDGVYGSRTRKAIASFQGDNSLKQDGNATVRLLTQVLMSASARPKEVPIPKTNEIASAPVKVETVKVSSTEQAKNPDGLVARIQSGLRAYGYDDLKVDGKMGQQTATAIQRFQLDYGMKITGEPSDGVLKKLRDIGAYNNG